MRVGPGGEEMRLWAGTRPAFPACELREGTLFVDHSCRPSLSCQGVPVGRMLPVPLLLPLAKSHRMWVAVTRACVDLNLPEPRQAPPAFFYPPTSPHFKHAHPTLPRDLQMCCSLVLSHGSPFSFRSCLPQNAVSPEVFFDHFVQNRAGLLFHAGSSPCCAPPRSARLDAHRLSVCPPWLCSCWPCGLVAGPTAILQEDLQTVLLLPFLFPQGPLDHLYVSKLKLTSLVCHLGQFLPPHRAPRSGIVMDRSRAGPGRR